jgi:hypothetical protein
MRDRYRRRNRDEPLTAVAQAISREPLPEQQAEAAELTEQLRALQAHRQRNGSIRPFRILGGDGVLFFLSLEC